MLILIVIDFLLQRFSPFISFAMINRIVTRTSPLLRGTPYHFVIAGIIAHSHFCSFCFLGVRPASSLITSFNAMVDSLPMREAVRYKEGNNKMSAAEINVMNLRFLDINL